MPKGCAYIASTESTECPWPRNQRAVIDYPIREIWGWLAWIHWHMFNKCYLLLKWTTRKTIFWPNSCIGIYMRYCQVKRNTVKRWSIYWCNSSIGNTWAPLKIRSIETIVRLKHASIDIVPSMGLLLLCADVIICWSLGTRRHKKWILRWGNWSILCKG